MFVYDIMYKMVSLKRFGKLCCRHTFQIENYLIYIYMVRSNIFSKHLSDEIGNTNMNFLLNKIRWLGELHLPGK